ncbi:uncharacterized protein DNG_05579 [Cephalotrichum gorgonifer]|uniref:Uncharacterized protein n=1 Tax=Cephalotrichum gorgonifer TaxID=2041049 RepID=A0AAE8MY56_9PEZI|nr:uncharacterized protein DNG_05579 [Cephalotrichum gorgonifer]
MSINKLSRPRTSTSEGPTPFDSASQRRVSRESGSSIDGVSMFSTPASSAAGSNASASTASTNTPSPFDSSSEPSTAITTPAAEDRNKMERGDQKQKIPSPVISQQRPEPSLPVPMLRSRGKGCIHMKMMIETTDTASGERSSKPTEKQMEGPTTAQTDLPFVKDMTPDEISKYSTEELMKMIIERE